MRLHEIAELTQQEQDQYAVNRAYVEGWLKRKGIGDCTIGRNNVVDVANNVDLSGAALTSIPIQFGYVSGSFYCTGMPKLKTLSGCPHTVGGDFYCYRTAITSLKGAPKLVKGDFYCDDTPYMKSLSGIDKMIPEIRGNFACNSAVTHILGLVLIKGLKQVDIDSKGPIDTIMNKYVGTGDILSCQDELLEAGFREQAKL